MKYLIALLAVAGMVVSIMALHVHYMDPGLAPPCAVTERFDCGAVNHSRFAVFPAKTFDEKPGAFHIPVATIGIAGYALIGVLALLGRWWLVFEFAQIGFFCAAFLSYLEAFVLQKWCIYCLWSQGIVTAILLLTIGVLAARWRQSSRQQHAQAAVKMTVNLDPDVYSLTSAYAGAKGITLSAAISELVRRAEQAPQPESESRRLKRNEHGYLEIAETGDVLTSEMVKKHSEDEHV